ncbi:MAG: hypothetical protein KBB46_03050 [Candidatus Pacebacteria bacterium]|nr:hypothetical protein [Candidatus Paceibacterota bacterium]
MTEENKVVNGALSYVSIDRGEWVRRGLRGLLRRLFRGDEVVMPSGDWREFIQSERNSDEFRVLHHEKQARNGFDSMSCTTFATLNAIELLMVAQGIVGGVGMAEGSNETQRVSPNYSDRFTSILAGTTQKGNTPQKVAESVRRFGLVPEAELPFSDEITTWEQFFSLGSAANAANLKASAKTAVRRFKFSHEWLWEERPAAEVQITLLRKALFYSPVGIAVYGWARGEDGKYIRNGQFANHWTLLVAITDSNDYVVLDSYEPFVKVLRKGYEIEFAKGYGVRLR